MAVGISFTGTVEKNTRFKSTCKNILSDICGFKKQIVIEYLIPLQNSLTQIQWPFQMGWGNRIPPDVGNEQ